MSRAAPRVGASPATTCPTRCSPSCSPSSSVACSPRTSSTSASSSASPTRPVTVYSGDGAQVGTLEVSSAEMQASLPIHGPEGLVAYKLDVQYVGLDGKEHSCAAQGTINAYEGANFAVRATAVGSRCVASLE